MSQGESVCLELATCRMLMFSSGVGVLAIDKAAAETITSGVMPSTISAVATAFSSEVKKLPEARANKIKNILSGGFVTRLKMEASHAIKKGVPQAC